MNEQAATPHPPRFVPRMRTIMSDLRAAFAVGRRCYRAGSNPRIGDLLHAFGPSGAALSALLVALPFIWPFSLGPLTIPGSVLILLLGYHLYRGRQHFPLPARYLGVPLPLWMFRFMRRMVLALGRWRGWNRVAIHESAVTGECRKLRGLCALGIIVGGLMLAVPIPLLPLTNTFPALAIIAFSVAHVGRSRSDFTWGVAFSVLSVLIFLVVGAAAFWLGSAGVEQLGGLFSSPTEMGMPGADDEIQMADK